MRCARFSKGFRSLIKFSVRYGNFEFKRFFLNSSLQWISWFLSSKGNEYFCEVEEDYILDRFNLTGLNNEVTNYSQALDLITDNLGTILLNLSKFHRFN